MDLTEFSGKAEKLRVLGIKVTKDGECITYRCWDEECRRNIYSASKSFTACAVGFAVQEGLLSLEEKLVDAFSEDIPENPSENLKMATVRDLLTMHLGQEKGSLMGAQRPKYEETDWVKLALSIPFVYPPNTHFIYNNVGPYLAGILVQRRAGCDLVSYLMPRLFEPLHIKRPTWEVDPNNQTFGAGGLMLTLSELHKFGLFCLQKGMWEGKQLLDPHWIEACGKQNLEAPYGYLFWTGEYNSFRADGKYSQLSIVMPEKQAVVTVVAECRDGDALLHAVYDDVCSQL